MAIILFLILKSLLLVDLSHVAQRQGAGSALEISCFVSLSGFTVAFTDRPLQSHAGSHSDSSDNALFQTWFNLAIVSRMNSYLTVLEE